MGGGRPQRLTREAIESGAVVHPLEADGLGRAPFQCWTAIRLPLLELALADPAVMARRRERAASEAKHCRVPAGDRCGCCRLPADDLYVICDATGKRNSAVCGPCLHGAGDGGLSKKARHLDHEFRRKLARVHPDRRAMR